MIDQQESQAHIWQEADGVLHIDVRGLPPPQPMMRVLHLLGQLRDDAVLVVHLERDPVWLYPELLQLGWWAEAVDGAAGEVRLRIARTP